VRLCVAGLPLPKTPQLLFLSKGTVPVVGGWLCWFRLWCIPFGAGDGVGGYRLAASIYVPTGGSGSESASVRVLVSMVAASGPGGAVW